MTEPTTPAGTTPVVPDPTPTKPAVDPAHRPSTPDAPEGPGGADTKTLDAMRAERDAALAASKAAEQELERLRTESLSESEKAIAAARKAGADEVTERLHARVRRAETKLALARAGALPSLIEDLASAAEFASLRVDDTDQVTGLEEALKAHKARVPDAYRPPVTPGPGSVDGGPRAPGAPPRATDLASAVTARLASRPS